jgi:hypothetical protein
MSASTLTTVAYIYKRLYMSGQPGDLAERDHPAYAMCRKEDGFTGTAFFYPIRYGNPQGVSGSFANAQSNAASSKGLQLQASRRPKFGVITMAGEAMAAARDDKGAFLRLVTQETDGVLEEMGDSFAFDFYRDGNGVRGQRSSISTNVVTLATADDARNFKVGMTVVADNDIAGTSLRTGSTTVSAVDEDAGTVTLTSAAAITSFADDDYLFRQGDPGTCMEGLAVLFPLTAPSSGESHRGVDRSVDPRRLAGVRVDDSSTAIEENAGLVAVKISQVGKKADKVCLNPIKFWEVVRRLNAKVEYEKGGMNADAYFEYFAIHTPAGTIKAYSDADCPPTRGYVKNSRTLFLKHLDGLPHIIDDDGRPSLREASADGVEARARGWVNLICTEPGANGVFSIA